MLVHQRVSARKNLRQKFSAPQDGEWKGEATPSREVVATSQRNGVIFTAEDFIKFKGWWIIIKYLQLVIYIYYYIYIYYNYVTYIYIYLPKFPHSFPMISATILTLQSFVGYTRAESPARDVLDVRVRTRQATAEAPAKYVDSCGGPLEDLSEFHHFSER